ncbi:unnamed protein product [Adineta ricciae]|uniref:Glucose-methanol-choline oxidoreductase N-terminal domain-containing protein n=1 Tax=Adineta ricciae TaxID=249248 RepID=A0A815N5X1_ADIRI|nr:unnamed protein product [Adineta ricciae]CAF1432921.1 unnamed protein product [Adineta ricciae]
MTEGSVAEQTAAPVVSESPSVIKRWEEDYSETKVDEIEYDYIIVGSGSAGSALASRLSEDETKQVLLIEAGGVDTKDEIHMPAACANCQRCEIDWQYKTVPQKNSHFACKNQVGNWPRGKVLGGCSSINYMQFVRGDPNDYNNWNLPEWTFDVMIKYFKKLEIADKNTIPLNSKYRSHDEKNGMVNASSLDAANELNKLFIESSIKNGFHQTDDYNAEDSLNGCVAHSQVSTQGGKRWSTASAYLLSAVKRKNFHLLVSAYTTKVTFDEKKNATGVIIRREKSLDTDETIRGKEVILSAGTIGSPQLLLLSGIGPRKELEKFQIPVIVDLPGVGKNLQDHLIVPIFYSSTIQTLSLADLNQENLINWATNGKGVLTSCVVESQSWCQVNQNEENNVPDIQTHFCPFTVPKDVIENFNYKDEVLEKCFINGNQWTAICIPTILHPKSRGEIVLASANPLDYPLIDPNYLENDEDVRTLIKACQLFDKICQTEPLKNVLQSLAEDLNEEVKKSENEEKFWETYIRKYGITVYHPVGTCRMGLENDPMTVVTQDTKVKGVQGLRVVDASIIPKLISGNTNIPTIALGERAADLIKSNF